MAQSKYTPEMVEEICKWIRLGNSNKDAATIAGVCEETFYSWQKEHAGFSEELKKAESEFKSARIMRIMEASKKSWQASAWLLERKYPLEFSLRRILELIEREKPMNKRIADELMERAIAIADEIASDVAETEPQGAGGPVPDAPQDVS